MNNLEGKVICNHGRAYIGKGVNIKQRHKLTSIVSCTMLLLIVSNLTESNVINVFAQVDNVTFWHNM
jgi:hypothetical protein